MPPTRTTTRPTPAATTPTPLTPDALARCVGDVAGFLDERFTRRPHVFHGEGFDDLLTMVDVDRQLAGAGLRAPAVRLVRDGDVVDPTRWTRRTRTGRVWIDDLVDPGRVFALFADGATVVLQALHRWWPPLTGFCRALEWDLGHPTQANAYLTPAGAAGLAPHHDTHDVFVLQLHGEKHWEVREPLVDAPLARHTCDHDGAANQPVLFDVDLTPGDVLYLPRGYIHAATAQEHASLHLTIGVLATTVHDLLRQLVDRAADDPAFRRSLPVGYGTDATVAAQAAKDVAAQFARWLDELDGDEVGRHALQRARRRRAPALDGQLLQVVALADVGDDTYVRARPDIHYDIAEADAGRVHVELWDRRLDLPAATRPALELLLDGRMHTPRELAGDLDESSRLVLVRRLVRDAALEVVDGS